ncbi:autophagocytosis associated protein [Helicostylum pulchrum]|nr:autophagocytosis associated protein [Helicostylum pulchrum]
MFISSQIEFESCLKKFYNETKSCSEASLQWTWETLKYAYLRRSGLLVVAARSFSAEEDTAVTEELDPASIETTNMETIQLEYHIVYSTSYQVPVLYFKACYQDATPLSLQEIFQKTIPSIYHDQVIITQTEHPLTGTPFWFIHPCDTQKLMGIVQFEYLDYIKTWLSFAGPIWQNPDKAPPYISGGAISGTI